MTSFPAIAELHDLALDLPRFEQALSQFAEKLHLDLSNSLQTTFRCAAIKTLPLNAGDWG